MGVHACGSAHLDKVLCLDVHGSGHCHVFGIPVLGSGMIVLV
jgi:hypothetical protein